MHRHHIIPKHEWKERFGNLRGFNHSDNVVFLTIEQHAECHKWLWEQYGRWEDDLAFKFLTNQITTEDAQRIMGRQVGLSNRGRKRVFSSDHIASMRHSARKPKSKEHSRNISKGLAGRIITDEWRKKISAGVRNYYANRGL